MVDKTNRRHNAAKKAADGTPAAKAATEILAVTLEEMAGRRIAGGRDTEAALCRLSGKLGAGAEFSRKTLAPFELSRLYRSIHGLTTPLRAAGSGQSRKPSL